MNIFRLSADLLHVASIVLLLLKMKASKSCSGISLRTHELYLLVFAARYLDLFMYWAGLYNTVLKLVFLSTTAAVVYLMRTRYRTTYSAEHDLFRREFLVGASLVMALIWNYKFSFFEVCWSFSIWLESIAILPQLFLLQKTGEVETITSHYVFALGAYRALYIVNWIYRYATEGYFSALTVVAGLVQTALYGDFFYHYYHSMMKGKRMRLPQ